MKYFEQLDAELNTLSTRAKRCLFRAGVYTVDDLLKVDKNELILWNNIGILTNKEICDFIDKYTFKLDINAKFDVIKFNGISDAELVNELRSRGYEVAAKKMIEL